MALSEAQFNMTYIVNDVAARTDEMKQFLFTLGCYPGEKITVISKLASNYIINVKDARYSIDEELASAILV